MRTVMTAVLLGSLLACSAPESTPVADTFDSVGTEEAWLRVDDMEGTAHDLGATLTEGREVALVFWQTWCASCIREAPHVVEAARRRADQTRFVGVVSGPDGTVDDAEVRRLTAELGLTYPQVRDRDAALAERFEVLGTPTIVVIAPDGRIVHRGHRLPESWSTP